MARPAGRTGRRARRVTPLSLRPTPAKENVRTVADLEYAALHRRSLTERASDAIARAASSSISLIGHTVFFGGWLLANTGWMPLVRPFDPFPFGLLTTIVSLEAIFLSLFILISQTRGSRQSEQRDHLDLQVNLLAEQESTVTLALLHRLCERAGVDIRDLGGGTRDLERDTNVRAISKELEDELPS